MKNLQALVAALVLIALAAILVGAAPAKPTAFSTDVAIQPGANNTFILKAKVKDAGTGEVLAGPVLKMPAGQTANAETSLEDSDVVVSLSANVDGGKHAATYTVTVKRGKQVVSEHTASLSL